MKTYKLSLLGLLAFIFFACTKTDDSIISSSSQNTTSLNLARIALRGGPATPVLTPSQSISPANVGDPVTVTFKATDPVSHANLGCGRVSIYKWDGSAWVEVASAPAPSASYTFTPSTDMDCAYRFRAGFAAGGGTGGVNCSGSYTGVDYTTQNDYCVDVVSTCVNTFTIDSDVKASKLNNGLYEFTVTYQLSSPVDVNNVEFQGGATAGGSTGHAITYKSEGLMVRNANNNNTVLVWSGNLKACTPQVVQFKYTRNFSCPANEAKVTGNWTAISGALLLGEKAELTYTCQ
jgi:hypothetical protein